jgi:hypothetical protein
MTSLGKLFDHITVFRVAEKKITTDGRLYTTACKTPELKIYIFCLNDLSIL